MTLRPLDLNHYYPDTDEGIQRALAADVAFDHLLALMVRQDLFEVGGLTFKGGTAIRKFRLRGDSRLSTDLDFDAAPDADALVAEEINGKSLSGFEFSITERRGFYTAHIQTPFGVEVSAKMDFSTRGLWLPPEVLPPVPLRIHERYDITLPPIPVSSIDENVAEKLSRWQNEPLVRDLHDLAELRHHIRSPELVARMWVLKSHQSMTQPRTRHPPGKPAAVVTDLFTRHPSSMFPLEDLIYPRRIPERHKVELIRHWLSRLPQQYGFCRAALEPPLQELADDIGHLTWRIPEEVRRIQAAAAST